MTGARVEFPSWIKTFPGASEGAVVIFPHAGGAAAAYRTLAKTLSDKGTAVFIVQYPQRADRLTHPGVGSLGELAEQLFAAGDWSTVGPLTLFGHCMGAVVAFEFARIAEARGVPVRALWPSAGQAPSTVPEVFPLPVTDAEVLADMVDLGGTDPRLLEDEDFAELLMMAVKADYRALSTYSCAPDVRISADIHVLGGTTDHRIAPDWLDRWASHTTGEFTRRDFEGGHFYVNDHTDAVAELVIGG
jgi:pyochelin biosynthetic protein PchC